jgi:tetratricopeptide (TPR) repeat protein
VLAVGLIADFRGAGAPALAGPVADLLATNLARVANLRVISTGRLYELMEAPPGLADAGAYTAAARRAGASMIVEGALHALADGGLRLDLRRIDVATGDVLAAETVSGHDLFALVDSGTAHLAAGVGAVAPAGSIADVTTRSEVAYRFYEEGLRSYYRGDPAVARRLFEAALAEDSTFAMAAYYFSLASQPGYVNYGALERALRLADQASDRERLIIRAAWAAAASDPSVLQAAETLSVRYPHELYGFLIGGQALIDAGDFPGAFRKLRQVIMMDSMTASSPSARCAACDARASIISAYIMLDSLDAAERDARAWVALQSQAAAPWWNVCAILMQRGRIAAAGDACREAAGFDGSHLGSSSAQAYFDLLNGEYEKLDRDLREAARAGPAERRRQAVWYLTIALRWQGRFAEALDAIRAYDGPETTPLRLDRAQLEAQVLLEMGRVNEATALFDSIAFGRLGEIPPYRARFQTWALAHGANALAAARDTARLAARIDTIRVIGARSLLLRDQLMHHYVRGLLHVVQRRDEAAIAEFRQALTSPTLGYGRISFELAGALVRAGRPREAVAVLQPAVRVPVEATHLYVTRTELRELLARAWADAGVPDSAIAHYDAVLAAWRNADPSLQDRVRAVRARRAALSGPDR